MSIAASLPVSTLRGFYPDPTQDIRGRGGDVGFDTMVALERRRGLPLDLRAVGMVRRAMGVIRPCRENEREAVSAIVNAAAEAYRGVIPADRWHDPYMGDDELAAEIAAGVRFWGYETDGTLVGVMGIQPVDEVDLIRHAYVLPEHQGEGVGTALLRHMRGLSDRPMLVGTWAAAEWAIRFYERNGFSRVSESEKTDLLRRYWTIPERQIETSVVLADRRGQTPNATAR